MRKGKKILAALLLCGMAAFGLAGCGKEGEDGAKPTQAAGEGITGQADEPTMSADAKKLKQFSDLAEGETYALINIKDFGTITVKFFPDEAPLAVENFVTHAKEGYYDGVTFHRVIDDFMIQGGDPTGTGRGGESIWGEYFADEFSDGLHPVRGALCMANTGYANTNSSQFFIVQADAAYIAEMKETLEAYYKGAITLKEYFEEAYSTALTDEQVKLYEDYGGTPWLFGHHTVFGQMLDGFEVLDAVAGVKTTGENYTPTEPVVIESIEILEYSPS